MSLVQSIFGDVVQKSTKSKKKAKKDESSGLAALFDKFPVAKLKKDPFKKEQPEKKQEEDDNDDSSASNGSSSSGSSSSSDDDNNNNDEKNKKSSDELDQQATVEADERTRENEDTTPISTSKNNDNPPRKIQTPAEKQDEEARTIFVGNLPLSTTRKTLVKLFSPIGKVESARLRSVAVSGVVKLPPSHAGNQALVKKVCANTQKEWNTDAKSSLQGYVRFAHEDCVPKAIAQFNNTPLQDTSAQATRAIRRIRVDTATPTVDPKRSVFCGNLPYGADENTLQEHACRVCHLQMQDIVGVRIVRDKQTFQGKGIGYILFQDATMVATALQRMHESIYMNRPLRVNVCTSKHNNRNNKKGKKKRARDDNNNYDQRSSNNNNNKRQRLAPGAMKRVARKQNKRMRGDKAKHNKATPARAGVSKRAAAEAKVGKRVKQLQRRISKGMGKARKS